MKRYQILSTAVALFLSSCILEERGNCPTYLTLDLTETPTEVNSLYLILQYRDGYTFKDTVYQEEFGREYEAAVPRGAATLAAYGNISNMLYDDGYVTAEGDPADDIYTYFTSVDYNGDLSTGKVNLSKNNIGFTFKVLGEVKGSEGLLLEITGENIGYTNTGELVEGPFLHHPESTHNPTPDEDYYLFRSRITRQNGEGAVLLKLYTRYPPSKEMVQILEISLTEKLREAGIDMADGELKDINITVDYSKSTITISVDNFENMDDIELIF